MRNDINKFVLFILLMIFQLMSYGQSDENKNSIYSRLEFTAQIGGVVYTDTARIIHIATTIHNPTSDTIGFITMSCSYEDFFSVVSNSDYVILSRYDCYYNLPILFKLPPNSKTDRYLMIKLINKNMQYHAGKIKIGLRLIEEKDYDDFRDLYNDSKNKLGELKLSNELDLERVYKTIY